MMQQDLAAGRYSSLASDYERYRIGYSSELFDALETLGFARGSRVLDVGCGTGLSLEPLVARGARVTGLDSMPEMLAIAGKRVPGAEYIGGTAERMPFADRAFDGAISGQAFHWFDGQAVFGELCRVVKPGRPVAIWWKILASDDALRALRAAACAKAGVTPVHDPLHGGFRAFYAAPFARHALRVLPFVARLSVDHWLGYEASRASVCESYGGRRDAYLQALRAGLIAAYGSAAARIDVRYTQYVYVGHTAE